jgi:anti-sigma B factor antagonist
VATIEVGGPGVVVVVRMAGEFDMNAEERLRGALDLACTRTSEVVVVDCSGIAFMDSSGLGVLVSAAKRLKENGCRLRLVHVPASIERVVKIVDLWEYLDGHSAGDPLDMHTDLALAWTEDAELRVTFG